MEPRTLDVIHVEQAVTLAGLFRERIRRTPDALAYRGYDPTAEVWRDYTWSQMGRETARWQIALQREELQPGDRVAVMMNNCPEWVMFDQAAMGCGLVTVPLYTDDRPENVAYILSRPDFQNLNPVKFYILRGEETLFGYLPLTMVANHRR